jgi:outer membrane lipoprotein-sorting protein
MNVKPWIAPIFVLSCLTLTPPARAADGPTVDSILSKYVEAAGGKAAMEKVSSRVAKIKVESDTLGNSEGEVFSTAPNKQRSHIDLGTTGAIDEGFDGTVAWTKSPWEALRVKTGDELAKAKRDAEFYRELKLKTLYPGLTLKGTEKVGEQEAQVLEAKPSATSKEKFWFSTKTGLLIREESEFEGPQGTVNVNMLAEDYKTIDGLKYPGVMKMKVSVGGQTFEFTTKISEVKHNEKIDAAKFAKPAE